MRDSYPKICIKKILINILQDFLFISTSKVIIPINKNKKKLEDI